MQSIANCKIDPGQPIHFKLCASPIQSACPGIFRKMYSNSFVTNCQCPHYTKMYPFKLFFFQLFLTGQMSSPTWNPFFFCLLSETLLACFILLLFLGIKAQETDQQSNQGNSIRHLLFTSYRDKHYHAGKSSKAVCEIIWGLVS